MCLVSWVKFNCFYNCHLWKYANLPLCLTIKYLLRCFTCTFSLLCLKVLCPTHFSSVIKTDYLGSEGQLKKFCPSTADRGCHGALPSMFQRPMYTIEIRIVDDYRTISPTMKCWSMPNIKYWGKKRREKFFCLLLIYTGNVPTYQWTTLHYYWHKWRYCE